MEYSVNRPHEVFALANIHRPAHVDKAFCATDLCIQRSATTHDMDAQDLVSLSRTVDAAAKYFREGGILDSNPLTMGDKTEHFETAANVVTTIQDLNAAQAQATVRQRQLQGYGIEILSEILKQRSILSPSETNLSELLKEPGYAGFKGGIADVDRARRLLHTLDELRKSNHTVLYLFRDSRLHNLFTGGRSDYKSVVRRMAYFLSDYLENLKRYPFVYDSNDRIQFAISLKAFYQLVQFPGAEHPSFSLVEHYWMSPIEQHEFYRHQHPQEILARSKNEELIAMDSYDGRRIATHLLCSITMDGEQRLTVAACVTERTILGLLPIRLRYFHPPEAHWIALPNNLYCEPLRGLFSLAFNNCTERLGNLALAWEAIQDPMTGFSPSYRIFVVASKNIGPLEPLSF